MKLVNFLNSSAAIGLGLSFSKAMPPSLGYPFARMVADVITMRRGSPMFSAVRANQWVVHNGKLQGAALEAMVRATFRSAGRSLYEFWHYFRDHKALLNLVEFDPSFDELIKRTRSSDQGTILVTPHISNFDLIGRAAVLYGLNVHVLSYPQPTGGYKWQNILRELPGMLVTPMSIQALREASHSLKANRAVLTGIDRPLPTGEDAKYRVRFFGHEASLPVFHIRLALKHNLPITMLGGERMSNGKYRVWASEPIAMKRHTDLVRETVSNAERVLEAAMEYIQRVPEQWAMFYPVWPEILTSVPFLRPNFSAAISEQTRVEHKS